MHSKRGRLAAAVALLGAVCCGTVRAADPPEGPVDDWRDLNPSYRRYLPPSAQRAELPRMPELGPRYVTDFGPNFVVSTTQPSQGARSDASAPDEQVLKGLVAELGSENPKTRTQAAAILRKMGKDALPALQAGVKDADAQVRASSQGLIDRIQHPEKYEPTSPANQGYAFDRGDRIRIMRAAPLRLQAGVNIMRIEHVGLRDVSITEPGRSVQIHEDRNGIRMTMITGGKPEIFQAANADELKRTAPEALKIYEQYVR